MQTDSIKEFTFTTSSCPDLNSLNLWRLTNINTLKISMIPRYREINVMEILDTIGKLKVAHSEILLKDVNHFTLTIPKILVQDCWDPAALKTVENQRGNSLP